MELKRVVVTGIGAITPIGNDAPTTWKNALEGVSGAGPITHFDASLFKTQFACEVKGYNSADYFDRKELRKYDLYAQYGVVSAKEAIEDAGLESAANLDRNRVGVIFAAGIGGLHTFEEEAGYYAMHADQGPKYNPFFIPKMIADMAAGHISMIYGYHGPNFATVSACASSTNALIDAFNYIRLGKADAIVTGGAEAAIFPAGVGGFNSMHAISTRNDDPQHASRPFSGSRDGFVMGEGGVTLVLEELEHALARGAHIYAEVAGGGLSADAYHLTASHPEGLGATLVMNNALEDAGCFALVLEKIPASLAERVTKELTIPVIGIGAGGACDGQVLVVADMLGMTKGFSPKFLRRYADLHTIMTDAIGHYIEDVKNCDFPNKDEQY